MPSALKIYVLKLNQGKYYVGKTLNVKKRYEEHRAGSGSAWTRKYRPVRIERVIPQKSAYDEDLHVKHYMAKYGIQNVRGGSYSSVLMDETQVSLLEKEIRHAQNKCVRCGRESHFVADCFANTDTRGNRLSDAESSSKVEFVSYESDSDDQQLNCFRCGREGHFAPSCYASYHVKGYRINSSTSSNSVKSSVVRSKSASFTR